MPRGDGTGPAGMGPMTGRAAGFCTGNNGPGYTNPGAGRGFGRGMGRGAGQGRRGQRIGRMGGGSAAGPCGNCVCPQCGHKEPHQRGLPCFEQKCPQCGAAMVRE